MWTAPLGVSLQMAVCHRRTRIIRSAVSSLMMQPLAQLGSGCLFVLTVLLAVRDVVWPIARVDDVVVEEGEGTLLDRRRAVPALPVPGAGSGVWEDSVLPLAVLAYDRLLTHRFLTVRASHSVRVVTIAAQAALIPGKG